MAHDRRSDSRCLRLAVLRNYARRYFSDIWQVDLAERKVEVAGQAPWKFDLVSADREIVGDVKGLKNIAVTAAKW
ncbi:hypothetical protein [Cryptosporangium sp. NPDC051539]|uniref:hypothetical protein n=1 Tax=Cryptosporangium sp. NPDC051539 TaxID=3363962 RepID=UPI0037BAE872